uniref:HP3 n=1 Tax=Triticum polonicum mycotymovirus 1 TaxID=2794439 RepID=A0A7T5QZA1_9VIRU|nr:HP3 [Triticum polonicum mycotymovirus 1]
MSDSMNKVTALLLHTPPTNASRPVRLQLGTMKHVAHENLTTRVLHQNSQIVANFANFSNCLWENAQIEIVPRAALQNVCLTFHIALHGSQNIPTTSVLLQQVPSCRTVITGQDGRLPSVITYPIEFENYFISPLIRPAPVQMPQAAITFTSSLVGAEVDMVFEDDSPLFDVFLRGTIAAGGSA